MSHSLRMLVTALVVSSLAFAAAAPARAQPSDPPDPEAAASTQETSGEGAAPEGDSPDGAAAGRASEPSARAQGPLPIMVIVLPARRVPDEVATAARAALVEQVTAMASGRPVHPLGAEAMIDAIEACSEDICVGAQLAEAGAQAGVILRLRPARRAVEATLEVRDPVSGAIRGEAVSGSLPREAEGSAEALAELSGQLTDAMPAPPPPPASLLVTVDVDGAEVQVDGQSIGVSPVAPVELAPGSHEIVVTAAGRLSARRRLEVDAGERARADITLRAIDAETAAASAGGGAGSDPDNPWAEARQTEGDITAEWWFWTLLGAGAAVLIGVAIGVGVAVSDQGPQMPEAPDGIRLPPIMGGM